MTLYSFFGKKDKNAATCFSPRFPFDLRQMMARTISETISRIDMMAVQSILPISQFYLSLFCPAVSIFRLSIPQACQARPLDYVAPRHREPPSLRYNHPAQYRPRRIFPGGVIFIESFLCMVAAHKL